MKKIFKALLIAILATVAVFACAFSITACGGKDDYVFTITYADGTAINGQKDGAEHELYGNKVRVQICETGENAACYPLYGNVDSADDIFPTASGILKLTQKQVDKILGKSNVTEFVLHVFDVKNCEHDCAFKVTKKGAMTCKLTAA